MKNECPAEILTEEGNNVAYFNNYESDSSQVSSVSSQTLILWTISGWSLSQFLDFHVLTSLQVVSWEPEPRNSVSVDSGR